MISEKDYFKLVKKFPFYKASPELSKNIVQKSGVTKGRSKKAHFGFSDLAYGVACLGIIAFMISAGFLNNPVEPGAGTRLAANTMALADQIACGAKFAFTGQK